MGQGGVRPAKGRDPASALFFWRQGPQVGRVPVVPPHVALIDGLRVVIQGSVVAPVEPTLGERRGELESLSEFGARKPCIHEADGLVMEILVRVPVVAEEILDGRPASPRDSVGAEEQIRAISVAAQRFR